MLKYKGKANYTKQKKNTIAFFIHYKKEKLMRLCVPIPCFFKNTDICSAIKSIAKLGYDAVEIYAWSGLDLKETKRVLDGCGVEMISMCTTEFRMTSPEHRELWLEGLKRSCEAANVVGAGKLITQVGNDTGKSRDYQHKAIVDTLASAENILCAHNVTIMPEPLNTFVDHKGYYLHSAYEGLEIIREVGSERVKLIYDIYHQQIMEGNIIPTITDNLSQIAHLHSAGHPGRHEPWMGESDYKFIFNKIDEAGYNGCCGLEYKPTMDPLDSLAYAKKLYG